MSKKVLILGIVVVLVVGGLTSHFWLEYSQAKSSLQDARMDERGLEETIGRAPKDVVRLKAMYDLTKTHLDSLEEQHSRWLDKAEVEALRTQLEHDKREIDQLAGAAAK